MQSSPLGYTQAGIPSRTARVERRLKCPFASTCWLRLRSSLHAVIFRRAGRYPRQRLRQRCSMASRRSEEHTSELQSLMRTSYAVFCLKNKNKIYNKNKTKHKIKVQNHAQHY